MHFNLMDPRLVAGVVVIVLIIVVGAAFFPFEIAEGLPRVSAIVLGRNTTGLFSSTGPNARPKRSWRIVKRAWKT